MSLLAALSFLDIAIFGRRAFCLCLALQSFFPGRDDTDALAPDHA